jgi:hypothetical protein
MMPQDTSNTSDNTAKLTWIEPTIETLPMHITQGGTGGGYESEGLWKS